MTPSPLAVERPTHEPATSPIPPTCAGLGDPTARLLAGPADREPYATHLQRLGEQPTWSDGGAELTGMIERSGVTGRGGGHFPLARKILAARSAGRPPVVVVNGTESEPASAKDELLLRLRPHLVIDGALALAAACGADRLVVAVHAGSGASVSLAWALGERGAEDGRRVEIATVPEGYIAGESSALVSYLGGGPAIPVAHPRPLAECGWEGRPTIVSNTETVSHLALIARRGDEWFRQAGTSAGPGSILVTMAGDVDHPGRVLEVLQPTPLAELVRAVTTSVAPWQGLLVGGYAGTWVGADRAGEMHVAGGRTGSGGLSIGCGLIGVVGAHRCGLAEAHRLAAWLTEQRAGQCGACSYGLPAITERLRGVAFGRAGASRTQRRVASIGHWVSGRGLCSLPDGAIAMVESALEVFGDESRLHRRGRCRAAGDPAAFPLPPPREAR